MSASNFLDNHKVDRVQGATAAGTTDIDSDSVDMQNFESVCFIVTFGTITAGAVTDIHVETSTDDSTFADLADTAITVAADDDDQTFMVEIIKPLERYLRLTVTRGTQNAVVETIYAIRALARKGPVTNAVADDVTLESHISPARGTK